MTNISWEISAENSERTEDCGLNPSQSSNHHPKVFRLKWKTTNQYTEYMFILDLPNSLRPSPHVHRVGDDEPSE